MIPTWCVFSTSLWAPFKRLFLRLLTHDVPYSKPSK